MPKQTYNNLLLYGGGIDSSALAMWLFNSKIKFDMLLINYNQKAYKGELAAAKYFANITNSKLIIKKINSWNDVKHPLLKQGVMTDIHNKNVIALRNQTFLNEASIYCLNNSYQSIYCGFHVEPKGSKFYDAKQEFVVAYQNLLLTQKIKLKIVTPFANQTKEQYIHNLNLTTIKKTFSCYESKTKKECGKCTHCKQKAKFIKQSFDVNEWRY